MGTYTFPQDAPTAARPRQLTRVALLAATPPEELPRARSCQREPCLRDGVCVCVSRWQVRESTACAARRDAALLAVRYSCASELRCVLTLHTHAYFPRAELLAMIGI